MLNGLLRKSTLKRPCSKILYPFIFFPTTPSVALENRRNICNFYSSQRYFGTKALKLRCRIFFECDESKLQALIKKKISIVNMYEQVLHCADSYYFFIFHSKAMRGFQPGYQVDLFRELKMPELFYRILNFKCRLFKNKNAHAQNHLLASPSFAPYIFPMAKTRAWTSGVQQGYILRTVA